MCESAKQAYLGCEKVVVKSKYLLFDKVVGIVLLFNLPEKKYVATDRKKVEKNNSDSSLKSWNSLGCKGLLEI